MTAVLLIGAVIILAAAAVAWRLGSERARPPLAQYSPWEMQGDLPTLPDEFTTSHSGKVPE